MKNQLNLRNNKMNSLLRSTLASSLIALTMMSCSKENIEPALVGSQENSRMRSNQILDENANSSTTFESAANNDQALIDIQIDETIDNPSYRILITRNSQVLISSAGENENQFNEYRLDPNQFTHLLDYLETFHTSSHDFTALNAGIKASQVVYRSCLQCTSTTLNSNGDAQERGSFTAMISEVDKIIDIQSLMHLHNNGNARD